MVSLLVGAGFQARIARNTTLMDLAAELATTVLCQLLGISIGRVTVWAHQAGNTGPNYAATLARRQELRKI